LLCEISFVAKRKILSNTISNELYKRSYIKVNWQAYIKKWGKIIKKLSLLWRELEAA